MTNLSASIEVRRYEIPLESAGCCVECGSRMGYLDPQARTFYKGSVKSQTVFSDRIHPKFNKRRVRCFDCAYNKFGNFTCRPNYHTTPYMSYLFDVDIDMSVVGVTLANMIARHGEVEGAIKYQAYCDKQAYSNTFEYKSEKYGWTKEQFDAYNQSRAVTEENLIARHGEEKGRMIFDGYKEKQAYTNTEPYFIEKYGEVEGKAEYDRVCSEKSITLENMIRVHGEEGGRAAIERWVENRGSGMFHSKSSLELFESLSFDGAMYVGSGGEFGIKGLGSKYYFYDYTIPSRKKIIEYHGDYWHGNPTMYEADYIHPHSKVLVSELWQRDAAKFEAATKRGFEVLVVWESEYHADRASVVDKCKRFIDG